MRITVDDVAGTHDRVSTTYKGLADDARPGDRLLVDDGKVGLRVVAVEGNDVVCEVTEGGPVSNNKGISLPGMNVSVPAMSEKDIADLEFALGLRRRLRRAVVRPLARRHRPGPQGHGRVGAARLPGDREAGEARGGRQPRGDRAGLRRRSWSPAATSGVELPLEHVPLVQKRAIQIARENAKPVIVATQMLDSMITNSRPTRAEAVRRRQRRARRRGRA